MTRAWVKRRSLAPVFERSLRKYGENSLPTMSLPGYNGAHTPTGEELRMDAATVTTTSEQIRKDKARRLFGTLLRSDALLAEARARKLGVESLAAEVGPAPAELSRLADVVVARPAAPERRSDRKLPEGFQLRSRHRGPKTALSPYDELALVKLYNWLLDFFGALRDEAGRTQREWFGIPRETRAEWNFLAHVKKQVASELGLDRLARLIVPAEQLPSVRPKAPWCVRCGGRLVAPVTDPVCARCRRGRDSRDWSALKRAAAARQAQAVRLLERRQRALERAVAKALDSRLCREWLARLPDRITASVWAEGVIAALCKPTLSTSRVHDLIEQYRRHFRRPAAQEESESRPGSPSRRN
jgi:hypothetical protein